MRKYEYALCRAVWPSGLPSVPGTAAVVLRRAAAICLRWSRRGLMNRSRSLVVSTRLPRAGSACLWSCVDIGWMRQNDVYASMSRSNSSIPRPCACTTVRAASRLLARVYDAGLADAGLNATQLAVLRAIDRMSGSPLSGVAAELSMDRTSLYRAVATMERDGWVRLEAGIDGRSRSARVTTRGAELLTEAGPSWDALQLGVIERFGRARWRALAGEIAALAEAAEAHERSLADGEGRG